MPGAEHGHSTQPRRTRAAEQWLWPLCAQGHRDLQGEPLKIPRAVAWHPSPTVKYQGNRGA